MTEFMPAGLVQAVLVLAPSILALSISAHIRLRRVVQADDPVARFRVLRWNSSLILLGGMLLLRESLQSDVGSLARVCGLVLSAEFFYVAWSNLTVSMSSRGLLLGMSFTPWQRLTTHSWDNGELLQLVTRTDRKYRLKVPDECRTTVETLVRENILK